jgi:hypothetical protein
MTPLFTLADVMFWLLYFGISIILSGVTKAFVHRMLYKRHKRKYQYIDYDTDPENALVLAIFFGWPLAIPVILVAIGVSFIAKFTLIGIDKVADKVTVTFRDEEK